MTEADNHASGAALNIPHRGLRVLEIAGADADLGAAYTGWLLARLGAEVSRLSDASTPRTSSGDPIALAAEVLAAGKSRAALPATPDAFAALLAESDVLLCDAPSALVPLCASLARLYETLPRFIIGVVAPLGVEGPYAALVALPTRGGAKATP